MELAQNSQVSASKKWLALAELTCNWQLKLVNFALVPSLSMGARGTLMYLNLTFMNLYCDRDSYTISKLSAKYQLCAIHTADNTDGKLTSVRRLSAVSEKVHRLDPPPSGLGGGRTGGVG